MKSMRLLPVLGLSVGVVFLFLSVQQVVSAVNRLRQAPVAALDSSRTLPMGTMTSIDSALALPFHPDTFQFTPAPESPFRLLAGHRRWRSRSTQPVPAEPLVQLHLKGILKKAAALAIIEDEFGKTFICKSGDKVHDQTVVSIADTEIVMRARGKKYTLAVSDR